MNAELREKLINEGVSEEAIQTLISQEMDTEDMLQGTTFKEFLDLGVKGGSARILAKRYAPQEVAQAQPVASAPAIHLINSAESLFAEYVRALAAAGGKLTDDLKASLRRVVPETDKVFVRVGNDFSPEESLKVYKFTKLTGKPVEVWEGKVTLSLIDLYQDKFEADPLTGEPLLDGINVTTGASWVGVSMANRKLAAFAVTSRKIAANFDPFIAIPELEKEVPSGRWTQIRVLWENADPILREYVNKLVWFRKGEVNPYRARLTEIITSTQDATHLSSILSITTRRFQILETQYTLWGPLDAPAHLIMQYEGAKAEVDALRVQLALLTLR